MPDTTKTIAEMRRAFFAGYSSCFTTFKNEIAEMPEDEGVARLGRYGRELSSFSASVWEGMA